MCLCKVNKERLIKMGIKRIIPCLDIYKGKVVKGINFVGLREVGDPVEYAVQYAKQGADEIVMLDIAATKEGRQNMLNLLKETVKKVSVPITAGGGIECAEDIRMLLDAGAKRISINTAAVRRPELIREAAEEFGSKCVVLAIDCRDMGKGQYHVMINGGKKDTGIELTSWASEAAALGAGEILLTSMDADGAKNGYDISMLNALCRTVKIPLIASGGCGTVGHFIKVFKETECDAALAASIFHYGDLTVDTVKKALKNSGIPVLMDKEGACA